MPGSPAATVVVSTYNRPRSLALVLAGFARQTHGDFEIIIADDGSGEETAHVIREFKTRAPMPVRHLWQEDRGFRKTMILNRAVLESDSDYLIFCDGDCLPHRNFVAGHLETREEGRFLFGHAVFLGPDSTEALQLEDVDSGKFEIWRWNTIRRGLRGDDRRSYNGIFLGTGWFSRAVGLWFDRNGRRARGRNISMSRADLLAVNGWNQDYERPGREDDDLVLRLHRLGRRGKSVRFRAVLYHLYHPPHSPELFATNDAILQNVIRSGRVECPNGIRTLEV
jgi:glycosyltransferase involved in cell wall biosynthesis